MADELDFDQEIDQEESKAEKRIKDLSEKVRLTATERDEKDKLLAAEKAEKETLIKERDFLNSFGDQLAKFPDASAFKDEIKDRVLKGYSVEDATAAVLVSKGKYTPPVVNQSIENFIGGSAVNTPSGGEKVLKDMSQAERRAKLVELEQRGDISIT